VSDGADDERTDPFADLDDAVDDREGDPFDRLDEGRTAPGDAEGDDRQETDEEPSSGTGPLDGSESRTGGPEGPLSGRIEDAEPGQPSFSEGEGRRGDPFDNFDDAFDREEIDRVDPDTVWEELESAQAGGSLAETPERTYAEVSKHSYCEQCEHFSAPPEIRCGHEGTQIVEFLDMETVRVVDCPVVAERKELREGGHGKD
jgi:hypothetical protein